MRTRRKAIARRAFLAVVAAISGARASGAPRPKPKPKPKIPLEKARAIALERVPGTVLEEELEYEDGRWAYEFEIRPRGERGRRVKEVCVDPETGAVLSVTDETSDAAAEKDDGGDAEDGEE